MSDPRLLEQLAKEIDRCRKCRLWRTRTKAVPGHGNPKAKVLFVGEAPGFNEDRQGIPFCGAAGKLLDKLLAHSGLKREDVWIGNVIKCRPPENRDPMVDELRTCSPYLVSQIGAISPKLIVTLGRFAMAHFLSDVKISEAHGKVYRVGKYLILPLYHPAAALRSEGVLRELERDFKQIPTIITKSNEDFVPVQKKNGDDNQLRFI